MTERTLRTEIGREVPLHEAVAAEADHLPRQAEGEATMEAVGMIAADRRLLHPLLEDLLAAIRPARATQGVAVRREAAARHQTPAAEGNPQPGCSLVSRDRKKPIR